MSMHLASLVCVAPSYIDCSPWRQVGVPSVTSLRTLVIQTRFSNNWHDGLHLYLMREWRMIKVVSKLFYSLCPSHLWSASVTSENLHQPGNNEAADQMRESVLGSMQGGARSSQPQVLQYKLSAGTSHPPRLTLISHKTVLNMFSSLLSKRDPSLTR